MSNWNYSGDVNVEHGGYWWRQDRPDDDCADIVEIIPDSDMGGADNVFHIHVGSVYLGWSESETKKALVCSGYSDDISEATVDELVRAVQSYCGYDMSEMYTIRIGPVDKLTNDSTVDEFNIWQIRGNSKLKNYIKRNFL